MQFVISEVLSGPPELRDHGAGRANTVACLTGSDGQGEYWCAQLDIPVQHSLDGDTDLSVFPPELVGEDPFGPYLWVYYLVLRTRDGRLFRPGAYRLAVDVAYVMDLSLSQDTVFNPAKVKWVAVAEINAPSEGVPAVYAERPSAPAPVDTPHQSDAAPLAPPVERESAAPAAESVDEPSSAPLGGIAAAPLPGHGVRAELHSPADERDPRPENRAEPTAGPPRHRHDQEAPAGWPPAQDRRPEPPPSPPFSGGYPPGLPPVMLGPKEFRQQLDATLAALAGLTGQRRLRPEIPCAAELKPGQPPPPQIPCYSVDSGGLHYHTKDPLQQTWLWRTTRDPQELLYWIIDDVARSVSWSWTQRSPSFSTIPPRQAQETLAMPYWVLLMQSLRPEWGGLTRRTVQAMLRAADPRGGSRR
jgi:hypothetical protein